MSHLQKKLLLIEDEPHLAFNLELNLTAEGYDVIVADNGQQGIDNFHKLGPFALVILDIMLPQVNGFDVLQEIRANDTKTGVLMLTARASDEDIIHGLKIGADDYMTKPFHLEELLLRVNRMAARSDFFSSEKPATTSVLQLGSLHLDRDSLVFKTPQGSFNITLLEAKVIAEFLANPATTLSRDYLLQKVWGVSSAVETRTVDNFIMRIRRYIEENPSQPKTLISVRGKGYKLMMRPSQSESTTETTQ